MCVHFPLIIGLHVKSGLGVAVYLSVCGSPCVWSGLSHISVRISRAVTPLLKSSGVSPFDSSLSNRAADKPPFTMSLFCSCGILHRNILQSGLEPMITTNGYRSIKVQFLEIMCGFD